MERWSDKGEKKNGHMEWIGKGSQDDLRLLGGKRVNMLIGHGGSRNFFLGWSLRNLNHTKSNKTITWRFAIIMSQVTKESKIVVTAKSKRI